jgi:hypothetical protein
MRNTGIDALVGGYDLKDAHIVRAADRPLLIDVSLMAGTELHRTILEDVAEVHRRIPRERMRVHWKSPMSPGRTVPLRSSLSEANS